MNDFAPYNNLGTLQTVKNNYITIISIQIGIYQDFQNCASREEEAPGKVGPATRRFLLFLATFKSDVLRIR